jgi:hypothetical protein
MPRSSATSVVESTSARPLHLLLRRDRGQARPLESGAVRGPACGPRVIRTRGTSRRPFDPTARISPPLRRPPRTHRPCFPRLAGTQSSKPRCSCLSECGSRQRRGRRLSAARALRETYHR